MQGPGSTRLRVASSVTKDPVREPKREADHAIAELIGAGACRFATAAEGLIKLEHPHDQFDGVPSDNGQSNIAHKHDRTENTPT